MAEDDLREKMEVLDARLSRIEAVLGRLDTTLQQLPSVLATVTDAMDEAVAKAPGAAMDSRLKAMGGLAERLSDPDTAARLTRLLDRLDGLEQGVELLHQAPQLVAIAADAADEVARGAQARGVDLDQRARLAASLVERLTEPSVVATLERLLDKLPAFEQGAMAAVQMPELLAIATDTVDEALGAAQARGVDVEARAREAARLLERATDPAVTAALDRLLDRSNQLGPLLDQLDALPGLAAAVVDTVDGALLKARAQGLDLDALLRGWLDISVLASRLFSSSEFFYHVEKGVLSPGAVRVVSQAGEAMSAARAAGAPEPAGPWAAVSALRDPDIQRVLGFGLRFARIFGRALGEPVSESTPRALKESTHV